MNVKKISFENLSFQSLETILNLFTREELREIARIHFIKRGQNKVDTINNLIAANGKLRINGIEF